MALLGKKKRNDDVDPRDASRTNRSRRSNDDGREQTKTVKKKRPVTAGKAFLLGLLAAFIVTLIMAGALILFNRVQAKQDTVQLRNTIDAAVQEVRDASSTVVLNPSENIRAAALDSNANLTVVRDVDGIEFTTSGSGVVLTSEGLILTNYHVIQNCKTVICKINGVEYYATSILGYDDYSDLAVIKVDARGLTPAKIGTSSNLLVGDWAMSVGNPYGLEDTLTSGSISALGRNFSMPNGQVTVTYANMIQTNTSVHEGSSGGGLYDSQGNLIGINTLVNVEQAQPQTIGYAIPVDFAMRIADRLKDGKLAQHAALGIQYGDVPMDMVTRYGLTSSKGALARSVTPSSPADAAGIIANDIIIKYNGEEVENAMDIYYKVWAMAPNSQVQIVVLREGKEMVFNNVTLGSDVQ